MKATIVLAAAVGLAHALLSRIDVLKRAILAAAQLVAALGTQYFTVRAVLGVLGTHAGTKAWRVHDLNTRLFMYGLSDRELVYLNAARVAAGLYIAGSIARRGRAVSAKQLYQNVAMSASIFVASLTISRGILGAMNIDFVPFGDLAVTCLSLSGFSLGCMLPNLLHKGDREKPSASAPATLADPAKEGPISNMDALKREAHLSLEEYEILNQDAKDAKREYTRLKKAVFHQEAIFNGSFDVERKKEASAKATKLSEMCREASARHVDLSTRAAAAKERAHARSVVLSRSILLFRCPLCRDCGRTTIKRLMMNGAPMQSTRISSLKFLRKKLLQRAYLRQRAAKGNLQKLKQRTIKPRCSPNSAEKLQCDLSKQRRKPKKSSARLSTRKLSWSISRNYPESCTRYLSLTFE